MNKLDAFEKLIQGNLEQIEGPADTGAWADMSARLDQVDAAAGTSAASGNSAWTWIGSAALVAGLVTGGYLLLNNETQTENAVRQLNDLPTVEYKIDSKSLHFNNQTAAHDSDVATELTIASITPTANPNHYSPNETSNTPSADNTSNGTSEEPYNETVVINETDPKGDETVENTTTPETTPQATPIVLNAEFSISTIMDICAGTSFDVTPSELQNGATYTWDFGDGMSMVKNNGTYSYKTAGEYAVQLTVSKRGKSASSTQYITVLPTPVAKFDWKLSENEMKPAIEFNNYSDDATAYVWNFDDGNSTDRTAPQHSFQRKGVYQVTLIASNNYGCSSQIVKPITVEKSYNLLAPTGFSPSGDGLNETWIPEALKVLDVNFKLHIVDSNGELAYVTQDANKPWDGYDMNGNIFFGATYVWVCIVINEYGEEEVYKGSVTLVR